MTALWPTDKVPGADRRLTEAEAAMLAKLQRRPPLNKRERDQLVKLQRKAAAEAAALALQCRAWPRRAARRLTAPCRAWPRRASRCQAWPCLATPPS
jgi:hypothetical protein